MFFFLAVIKVRVIIKKLKTDPLQIKVNTGEHNCKDKDLSEKIRPASSKWIATTIRTG